MSYCQTPFYSWIYTLQSQDMDTFWAFDTSNANDQLINLIYSGVKSHFQKIIYRLDILFKTNPMIINLTWYDCDISSGGSIIFWGKGRWSDKEGRGWVKVKILNNVLSTYTVYILMYTYNNQTKCKLYM